MSNSNESKIIAVGNPRRDLPRDLLFSAYSNQSLAKAIEKIALTYPMGSDEFGLLLEARDRLQSM